MDIFNENYGVRLLDCFRLLLVVARKLLRISNASLLVEI